MGVLCRSPWLWAEWNVWGRGRSGVFGGLWGNPGVVVWMEEEEGWAVWGGCGVREEGK